MQNSSKALMKILLIGEYSNVHATLAEGLRYLGHDVTVFSNGDFWKNYKRDIDLVRIPTKIGGLIYLFKLLCILPKLRGYDIVQLINPMFLELKAERILPFYKYLRKYNKKIFLGGFGMDWYWVHTCRAAMFLRYSDFNIGKTLRTNRDAIKETTDWIGTSKERLNKHIAADCDGIIAGLYEYYMCYYPYFPRKTTYIPYPIKLLKPSLTTLQSNCRLRLFIGINKARSEYKGTDIMLAAARSIARKYSNLVELKIAESIPFEQYQVMMNGADVILDQLYSYTPSMNSLLAMSKGIICIGGGEPECYEILHEQELKPIINVQPNYKSVYRALENLVLHPQSIPELKRQSMEYVKKHHDYIQVAHRYEQFYTNILCDSESQTMS